MRRKITNDFSVNWIEFLFRFGDKLKIPRIIFSMVYILLPAFILYLPFIFNRYQVLAQVTIRMLFGVVSGMVWMWLGPYLINRYCMKIDTMFALLKKNKIIAPNQIDIVKSVSMQKLFRISSLNIIWIVGILLAALIDSSYLFRFGTNGFSDVYLYLFSIVIMYLLYFTSIGFKGVICTIKLINYIVDNDLLSIDYFNADKAGGIACIKKLVLSTTMLFSTGVFYLPILLDYIIYTNSIWVKLMLYVAILFFSIFIFLSFYLPLRKLYDFADGKKNIYIEYLSKKYKKLINMCLTGTDCSIEDELAAVNIYNFISSVDKTTVFKFRSEVVFQVLTAIGIPLFCFFVNAKDVIQMISEIVEMFY